MSKINDCVRKLDHLNFKCNLHEQFVTFLPDLSYPCLVGFIPTINLQSLAHICLRERSSLRERHLPVFAPRRWRWLVSEISHNRAAAVTAGWPTSRLVSICRVMSKTHVKLEGMVLSNWRQTRIHMLCSDDWLCCRRISNRGSFISGS